MLMNSCFFPEQFDAKITINKDGTFSLRYDGILTFIPAKQAEAQEKLTPEEENQFKQLEQQLLKEPGFKKAEYQGHGRFKVLCERTGNLNSSVYFPGKDNTILSIAPTQDGKIEVRGMKLSKDDAAGLRQLKMQVDGRVEISTDATVVSHNAKDTPKLGGLWGAYAWQIKNVDDPAPYMAVQFERQVVKQVEQKRAASVEDFIAAVEKKEFTNVFQKTYYYQKHLAEIKSGNPQVLWSKLISEYFESRKALFAKSEINFLDSGLGSDCDPVGSLRQLVALLPPSAQWRVLESKHEEAMGWTIGCPYPASFTKTYVSVKYSSPDTSPFGNRKLLKEAILEFSMEKDHGLYLTSKRFEKGDVYWERVPFRITGVCWQADTLAGLTLTAKVIGGTPPFHSETRCNNLLLETQKGVSITSAPDRDWIEIKIGAKFSEDSFPMHCVVTLTDQQGSKDSVAFTVREMFSGVTGFCWVRNPWYDAKQWKETVAVGMWREIAGELKTGGEAVTGSGREPDTNVAQQQQTPGPAPVYDPTVDRCVGETIAGEVSKLINQGDVVVLSMAGGKFKSIVAEAQLEGFRNGLRQRTGIHLLDVVGPDQTEMMEFFEGVSEKFFMKAVSDHPSAKAIVSFMGVPIFGKEGELIDRTKLPKIIALNLSATGQWKALVKNGVVSAVILPRYDVRWDQLPTKGECSEIFKSRYVIVTTENYDEMAEKLKAFYPSSSPSSSLDLPARFTRPSGPTKAVLESSQGGVERSDTQKLTDFIIQQMRLVAQIPPPKRDWKELVSMKLGATYENHSDLYLLGVNRRSLAADALVTAKRFLDKGDLENAKLYASRGTRYYVDSNNLFNYAEQQLATGVGITADVLNSIYTGSKEATQFGLTFAAGPKAGEVVDYLFLATDYAVDYGLQGKDKATKDLARSAVAKVIADKSGLSDWIEKRTTHLIGSSDLYELLDEQIHSRAVKTAVMKVLAESAAYKASSEAEDAVSKIFEAMGDFLQKSGSLKKPSDTAPTVTTPVSTPSVRPGETSGAEATPASPAPSKAEWFDPVLLAKDCLRATSNQKTGQPSGCQIIRDAFNQNYRNQTVKYKGTVTKVVKSDGAVRFYGGGNWPVNWIVEAVFPPDKRSALDSVKKGQELNVEGKIVDLIPPMIEMDYGNGGGTARTIRIGEAAILQQ